MQGEIAWGIALSALVCVCGIALALVGRTRVGGCAIAAFAVGAMLGCAQAYSVHAATQAWEGVAGEQASLVLLEDSDDNGFGEAALVEARSDDFGTMVATARFTGGQPLLCGERVRARVTFTAPDERTSARTWQLGSSGTLKASEVEVESPPFPIDVLVAVRSDVIGAIGGHPGRDGGGSVRPDQVGAAYGGAYGGSNGSARGPEGSAADGGDGDGVDEGRALIQALVCGYRRPIERTALYAAFQTCGLAHLVAVSGAHLVIVTGLLASLLKRLRTPRAIAVPSLVAAMASFYVIAGMPISALRALIMSSLGLVSFFGKRRPSSLNAVGVGLFVIIGASPASSVSASLALSGLSTTGIVMFGPLVLEWLARTPLRRFTMAKEALALTISASLLSQLYACSLFSQLPLISPLANVAAAPLFPLACTSGLVEGMLAVLVPDGPFPIVAPLVANVLSGAVVALSHVPCASIPFSIDSLEALGVTALAAFSLWAFWPRMDRLHVACLCVIAAIAAGAVAISHDGTDKIVMLDVGQGDAVLVESRGATLLIDTGNQDTRLLEQLGYNRIMHLDSVLITHADDDHYGSLDALAKAVHVDRVIMARDMLECEGASAKKMRGEAARLTSDIVGVSPGDTFTVGAFAVRVVWPYAFKAEGGNPDSLCVMVEYDGDADGESDVRALMTGDAEADELEEMISSGSVGDIDILKVGHHGSRKGMTKAQLSVLKPEIALISCGEHNRYGHPAPETVALLDEAVARTFRTDKDGEIRCMLCAEGVSVECIP